LKRFSNLNSELLSLGLLVLFLFACFCRNLPL